MTLGKAEVDDETTKLMEKLVADTISYLGEDNCHTFEPVKWNNEGGTNERSLETYLVQLGKMFEERVKILIDRVCSQTQFAVTRLS